MINEERVKQLYKVALYEQQEEKLHRHSMKYNGYDYISKEIFKSIFVGIIAYVLLVIFWLISLWADLISGIAMNQLESFLVPLMVSFLGFMTVYILVTIVIYSIRYKADKKRWENYKEELNLLDKMYDQEEKFKQ